MLVATFLALGLIAGFIQGGSTNSISLLHIRNSFLIVTAFLLQAIVLLVELVFPQTAALTLNAQVTSYLLVLMFLLSNRQLRYIELVAVGLTLNLVAIILSGYAPGSPSLYLGEVFSTPGSLSDSLRFSAGDALISLGLLAMTRDVMLARAMRPELVRVRYQPKHLAGALRQAGK